jgi:hypothetical protein
MWSRADNVRGLKPSTEAWGSGHRAIWVLTGRGVLPAGRSVSASRRGPPASKDAGISSAKAGANPAHRKPQVSAVQFVCCRSVGPKARPLGVVDGCDVYIRQPGAKVKRLGTLSRNPLRLLVCRADPSGVRRGGGLGGREKPRRYNAFDRTANRHR